MIQRALIQAVLKGSVAGVEIQASVVRFFLDQILKLMESPIEPAGSVVFQSLGCGCGCDRAGNKKSQKDRGYDYGYEGILTNRLTPYPRPLPVAGRGRRRSRTSRG